LFIKEGLEISTHWPKKERGNVVKCAGTRMRAGWGGGENHSSQMKILRHLSYVDEKGSKSRLLYPILYNQTEWTKDLNMQIKFKSCKKI
jgi:hypothetical protein